MGQDRIPQRSQRSGSSGPNDRDRGSGDIWRFVGCLLVVLVGSWPALAPLSCYVCRGSLLVARVARYRGGATFRLRSESTEASTGGHRGAEEVLLLAVYQGGVCRATRSWRHKGCEPSRGQRRWVRD